MWGKLESALAFSVVMVRTVVTPRVILAGVALLITIINNAMMTINISSISNVDLLTQKLSQDMMTIKTAGV